MSNWNFNKTFATAPWFVASPYLISSLVYNDAIYLNIKHPENEKKSGNFNSHESSTENTIIGELGKPCNGQRPFSRSEFTSSTLIAFNVVTTTSDQYNHVLHDLYPPVMFLWNKHKLSWLYTNDPQDIINL